MAEVGSYLRILQLSSPPSLPEAKATLRGGRCGIINSDGCQKGLRYRFAHASHNTAAAIQNNTGESLFGSLGDTPRYKNTRELPL